MSSSNNTVFLCQLLSIKIKLCSKCNRKKNCLVWYLLWRRRGWESSLDYRYWDKWLSTLTCSDTCMQGHTHYAGTALSIIVTLNFDVFYNYWYMYAGTHTLCWHCFEPNSDSQLWLVLQLLVHVCRDTHIMLALLWA